MSLLPICGKTFEKLKLNGYFMHYTASLKTTYYLFCVNEASRKMIPINQIVSIIQEIYSAFDCNPFLKVRGIFLNLSKAFDKVWHDDLIYKFKLIGISGSHLN